MEDTYASAEQRRALAHPTRHRITLALQEPMTVSALARELRINKGNVAHHITALERVGLVRRVGTRTGRGGTGVLYERVASSLSFSGPEATDGMLQLVSRGLKEDPHAFAFLRRLHLTPAQARHLSEHLDQLLWRLPQTEGVPATAVFVSVCRD